MEKETCPGRRTKYTISRNMNVRQRQNALSGSEGDVYVFFFASRWTRGRRQSQCWRLLAGCLRRCRLQRRVPSNPLHKGAARYFLTRFRMTPNSLDVFSGGLADYAKLYMFYSTQNAYAPECTIYALRLWVRIVVMFISMFIWNVLVLGKECLHVRVGLFYA